MRTKKKLEDFRDTFGVVKDSRGNLKFTKSVKEEDMQRFLSLPDEPSLKDRVLIEMRAIPLFIFVITLFVLLSPVIVIAILCRYITNFSEEDKE